jgi:hypothetical protein
MPDPLSPSELRQLAEWTGCTLEEYRDDLNRRLLTPTLWHKHDAISADLGTLDEMLYDQRQEAGWA